ncbi:unnamed protein product [Tenebrio molitor]|nr:unnamed protein product [Tenebrio molitor]
MSFTLLKDLDGNKMKFTTSGYQLLSNQYKPTGLKVHFNVCEYWKKDIYGSTTHLKQFGNLEGCDIKKGHYHLYNYMPDESQFPKYVPLGSYMAEIKVEWNSGVPIGTVHWYITSKFKLSRKNNRRSNQKHIFNFNNVSTL